MGILYARYIIQKESEKQFGILYKNIPYNLVILYNKARLNLLHLYCNNHIDNIKLCAIIKEKQTSQIMEQKKGVDISNKIHKQLI